MKAGITIKTHDKEDHLRALPKELLAMIFSFLPYSLQIKLRGIAPYWKESIENFSRLPLLNAKVMHKALSYTSSKATDPIAIGLPQLRQNYAEFHLCPQSVDSLIMRFFSKVVYETTSGQWQSKELEFPIKIPVSKVFLFAFHKAGLDQQYLSLQTREQRHAFITHYMDFPDTAKHPRHHFLKNQSKDSLVRLKESLSRYQDPRYQALILEVERAIAVAAEKILPKRIELQVR